MIKRNSKFILFGFLFLITVSCEKESSSITDVEIKNGSYTYLIIPDTQNYFENNDSYDVYMKLFRWIAENSKKFNIKAILQTGDITQRNSPEEWLKARKGYDLINNEIPYIVCIGNHDYEGSGNPKNRNTLANNYFSLDEEVFNDKIFVEKYGYFEENKLENYYVILNTYPKKTLVVSLEWYTRDEPINWCDSILNKYTDLEAIILTHAYLDSKNSRYNYTLYNKEKDEFYLYGPKESNKNNALQVWDKLIKKHSNIILVLNGHDLGASFLRSPNNNGGYTNQMMFNCQNEPNGGNGWIRLLEFWADSKTVEVHTISPTLMKVRKNRNNYFLFSK